MDERTGRKSSRRPLAASVSAVGVAMLLLVPTGCAPRPEPPFADVVIPLDRDVELTEADDGSTIELEVGQRFSVRLDVAYGDSWKWAGEAAWERGAEFPLKPRMSDYLDAVVSEGESLTGARKWEYVFEAVADGRELIVLEEFAPGGERTGRRWSVTVVVGGAGAAAERTDRFALDVTPIVDEFEVLRVASDKTDGIAEYRSRADRRAEELRSLLARARALEATGEDAATKADLVYVLELETALADEHRAIARQAGSARAADEALELRSHDFEDESTEATTRWANVLTALGRDG